MNQIIKTICFIVVAVVLCAGAGVSHLMTRPKAIGEFEKVGKEFFADFRDPSKAVSMEVSALDPDTKELQEFKVELKDGLWRIPSHHGYPAEAGKRLAETAVSLIGLKRESLVGRRENQYERYGVVDPKSPNARDPKESGRRITLRNAGGDVLADYIIGQPAGSKADPQSGMAMRELGTPDDYYYVRVPNEKETYKAEVQLDLSTRFSDWIEPDLLKLEGQEMRELVIDNYELQDRMYTTQRGIQVRKEKVQGDLVNLKRDTGFAQWTLGDLNAETEELESAKISQLVNFLDNVEITGVRPKPKFNGQLLITPECTLNEIPELRQNQALWARAMEELGYDLDDKGFTLVVKEADGEQQLDLVGYDGLLTAVTENGVVYSLNFGKLFYGDNTTIEIGAGNTTEAESTQDPEAEDKGEANADAANADQGANSDPVAQDEGRKSRYLAIRVAFDQAKLGEQPVQPIEPEKPEAPEGYDQWKKEQDAKAAEQAQVDQDKAAADSSGNSDKSSGDQKPPETTGGQTGGKQDSDNAPDPPNDVQDQVDKTFRDYEAVLETYNADKRQHDLDLSTYESELATYRELEEAGKEKAAQLNQRFAEWYYVISAEDLDKLKLPRSELVKAKEPAETPPLDPNIPGLSLPERPSIQFPGSGESGKDGTGEPAGTTQVPPDSVDKSGGG